MSARNRTAIRLASLAMLAFASLATAAPSRQDPPSASQPVGSAVAAASKPLAARERARLSRALSTQWGIYVQRVYGVEADVWARRMAPSLATADADNLRNAVSRDTFEGAMAELGGAGAKLADDQVIDVLAAAGGGNPTPQALGVLSNDLVYTPIHPCRIIDTRSTVAGAIAADSTRSFVSINANSFSAQGGSVSNCGTLGLAATAVAINLTAVNPSIAGYATVYPFGSVKPLASSSNYAAGAIVNNALIVQIPNPVSSFDLTIYSYAQAHYVADIVGYFAPPEATALQCLVTAENSVDIAGGGLVDGIDAAPCPSGYTQTATNCSTTGALMPLLDSRNGWCSARNGDSVTRTLSASRTCCRVPGR